jgi:hypothetical protein
MLRSPGERLATVKREAHLHLLLSEHGIQEVLEHQLGPGVQHLDVSTEGFADLDKSTPQGPELHLVRSAQQEPLLLLDMSTL